VDGIENESSSDNAGAFKIVLAESNDSWNRNAILYDSSLYELIHEKSWNRQSLPKADVRAVPWSHTRGPLSVILRYRNKPYNELLVVNYHLKSKASGWKDPAGTMFEFQRMLAAGGIREIINSEKNRLSENSLTVLLGDRNANSSGAASEVLSGRLVVRDFSSEGKCRISQEGTALCPPDIFRNPDMIPLLQDKSSKGGTQLATYRLGRRLEILDEIYISREDFENQADIQGEIDAGTAGEFMKGSDHLLSYVRLAVMYE
jgi:hypothetical protein